MAEESVISPPNGITCYVPPAHTIAPCVHLPPEVEQAMRRLITEQLLQMEKDQQDTDERIADVEESVQVMLSKMAEVAFYAAQVAVKAESDAKALRDEVAQLRDQCTAAWERLRLQCVAQGEHVERTNMTLTPMSHNLAVTRDAVAELVEAHNKVLEDFTRKQEIARTALEALAAGADAGVTQRVHPLPRDTPWDIPGVGQLKPTEFARDIAPVVRAAVATGRLQAGENAPAALRELLAAVLPTAEAAEAAAAPHGGAGAPAAAGTRRDVEMSQDAAQPPARE